MKHNFLLLSTLFLTLISANAYGSGDSYWGWCGGPGNTVAYVDKALTLRKPGADWVCAAPTAQETGDARDGNSLRCLSGQRRECEIGAGGVTGPGDHNVTNLAWYWIPGVTPDKYPDVKCQCGCFSSDVTILTTDGYRSIGEMAKNASQIGGYSVATLNDESQMKASVRLKNKDFTVGPEEKALFHFKTFDGQSITLTDSHPVLVEEDGEQKMVQAAALDIGSRLVLATGATTQIIEINHWKLSKTDNLVYNLNTKGQTEAEHIIFANGLRVGDLYWQKKLSEKSARVNNIIKFSSEK